MLRMSKMVFCILVSTLLLTMTACSSLRTHSDYDPDARFDNYTTFAWMGDADVVHTETPDDVYISPLNVQRIERAIENELTTHGCRQLENPDDADFLVTFTVGTRDRIYVERYPLTYRELYPVTLQLAYRLAASYPKGTLIAVFADIIPEPFAAGPASADDEYVTR